MRQILRNLTTYIAVPLVALLLGCSGGNTGSTTQPSDQPTASAPTPTASAVAAVDPLQDKGIGPVTSVTLGEIDEKMVTEGKRIFKLKCTACHKMKKRRVGPPLAGVTKRRTPEWIMNFILNPAEMLEKNQLAKDLLKEYSTPMANQNITEPEARAILEYLRTKE